MKFEIVNNLQGDNSGKLLYLVKYYWPEEPENSGFEFFIANDNSHLKELVANKLKSAFENNSWKSADDLDESDFEAHFENDWDNWITYHHVGNCCA